MHERLSRFAILVCVGSALVLAGCYKEHRCAANEDCNLRDDDCDGQIDEGLVDANGRYTSIAHCGTCGVDCRRAFPTASEVVCTMQNESVPTCQLVRCPNAYHRADDGSCVPDTAALCLACRSDEECSARMPGALCLPTDSGADRCGEPCSTDRFGVAGCPLGFACETVRSGARQCVPTSGLCGCNASTNATLACTVVSPSGARCAGEQRCSEGGPTACEAALAEACNAQDDDCDGAVDESFLDAQGIYVSAAHCGACGNACATPGPNMRATCRNNNGAARCDVVCETDFVDVDGIVANGCECQRWNGVGPPPELGGDSDCDGIPDVTADFIYVTSTGSDTNPGTREAPMRSLAAAAQAALLQNKSVLIARGVYEGGYAIVDGVSIFGGYAPDFRDRNVELYPVWIVRTDVPAGLPALSCTGPFVRETRLNGLTIVGRDAVQPGQGSTAVLLRNCGSRLTLENITVLAGRGADGERGDDSSTVLRARTGASLADLNGPAGRDGAPGTGAGQCRESEGGAGGAQFCGVVETSGGRGGAATCPGDICQNGSPCANAGCTDFTVNGRCDLERVMSLAIGNPLAGDGRGDGGGRAGERTYNSPTNRSNCNFCDDNPTIARDGGNGADGASGVPGIGGIGCSENILTIEVDGRAHASAGSDGTDGGNGSGGGGGSAGAGFEVIGGTTGGCSDRAGGSGGGGGAGGCGTPGATRGMGGGVSIGIAIEAQGSGPTLSEVRIVSASGGRGGDGGQGAEGGTGGSGANGGTVQFWCSRNGGRGGDGGDGGRGGGGGGGCGGSSLGIFVRGASPDYREALQAVRVEATGVPGIGGRGGFSRDASGGDGAPGLSAAVLSLP